MAGHDTPVKKLVESGAISFKSLVKKCFNMKLLLNTITITEEQSYDQKSCYRHFFSNLTLTVTLTLDLAALSLLTAYCVMLVNICVYKFLRLMKKLMAVQAVLSHLTLKPDLGHGPSHTFLAHCLMMVNICIKLY